LSREAILSRLRGIEYDGIDRSVDIAVSRLRRKLEQEPAHPVAIKTVRGRGELAVRATMPKRAPLRLLGETFNRMAERIQRLVESHRNLTNAVSHELRTPISRLRFGLEMLQRSDDPCDRQR